MDKIYLYAKDPYETKDQLLINKRQSLSLSIKHKASQSFYRIF